MYRFDEQAFKIKFRPVVQTSFKDDSDGSRGNCFQACVATILGFPLQGVPEFSRAFYKDTWMDDVQTWLAFYGLRLEDFTRLVVRTDPQPIDLGIQNSYYIVSGPSTRGDWAHACVGFQGEIVHDPHPDKGGLADGWRSYEWFVPIKFFPENIPLDIRKETP